MATMQGSGALDYAAEIAASSTVVSKRAYRRGSWPFGLSSGLRAPALPDVPRLFASARKTRDGVAEDGNSRVTRITAASLLYSLNKDSRRGAYDLLEDVEKGSVQTALQGFDAEFGNFTERRRFKHEDKDRRCYYCALFENALYAGFGDKIPAVVLNHAAHVEPNFDPDANISSAEIKEYQVLVSEKTARAILRNAHPLHWSEAAPSLFKETRPAQPVRAGDWDLEALTEEAWNDIASKGDAYIYEDVTWPWSEAVSSEVQNIIKVTDLVGVQARDYVELSYDYSLQACLRTDLGYGPEPGGLDIDDGYFEGVAVPFKAHLEQRGNQPCTYLDLRPLPKDISAQRRSGVYRCVNLQSRDVLHLKLAQNRNLVPPDLLPSPAPAVIDPVRNMQILKHLCDALQDPWLVTISESKRLRYTRPGDSPVELWSALTWLAPALLFVFINRGVAQAAHVLTLNS